MKNLEKISKKYGSLEFNKDNFGIGGGLSNDQFASRRHEDAKNDEGKLTFGKACQMFKKATGNQNLQSVKNVIQFAIPNMEWHHAGKLPKNYGGGMKKTFYLNSEEIVNLADNWLSFENQLELSNSQKRDIFEKEKDLLTLQNSFLEKHAEKVVRTSEKPLFFIETDREMDGKYGWFSSYGKSYKMQEYYTGWAFKDEKTLNKYSLLK